MLDLASFIFRHHEGFVLASTLIFYEETRAQRPVSRFERSQRVVLVILLYAYGYSYLIDNSVFACPSSDM